jgi:hypothetical protein
MCCGFTNNQISGSHGGLLAACSLKTTLMHGKSARGITARQPEDQYKDGFGRRAIRSQRRRCRYHANTGSVHKSDAGNYNLVPETNLVDVHMGRFANSWATGLSLLQGALRQS